MIFYFIFLAALLGSIVSPQTTPISTSQLAIKSGIATVTLNSNDAATVSITYSKNMPDPVYNSVATLAYISNYAPSRGLNFSANCNSGSDQVKLQCAVVAQSSSTNNIIYMTYVVSDQPDFIVGSFLSPLNMGSPSLSTSISTILALPADSPFKVARNAINFIPLISGKQCGYSGVSCLDRTFAFSFGFDQSFDVITSTLQFTVTISEFQQKSLNLTFGFILFLADRYVLNVFPDKRYEPSNPNNNNNIIYAIQQISFIPPQPKSAAASIQPSTANTSPSSLVYRQDNANFQAASASITSPAKSVKRSLQTVQLKASEKPKFNTFLQQFQNLVTDGSFSLSQVRVRTVTQEVIKNEAAPTNKTNIYQPIAPKPEAYQSAAAKAAPTYDSSAATTTTATNTNEFQQLFATNGFTIIVNTTISDPVLYLELDPYVNVVPQGSPQAAPMAPNSKAAYIISAQSNPPPLYIAEPINTKPPQPIACINGFLVVVPTKISFIQQTYRFACRICAWGQYFDWSKKKCIDFPIISSFVNMVDSI